VNNILCGAVKQTLFVPVKKKKKEKKGKEPSAYNVQRISPVPPYQDLWRALVCPGFVAEV